MSINKFYEKVDYFSIVFLLMALFAQIVETFVGKSGISAFFDFIFLLMLVFKLIRKGKISKYFIFRYGGFILISFFYYFLWFNMDQTIYPWARAGIICFIVWPIIITTINKLSIKEWTNIENFIFIYIIINIALWISNNQVFFGHDGISLRFKGASDNPNQFAVLLFSLFILILYRERKIVIISKILLLMLILLSGSRLYFVLSIILILIKYFDLKKVTRFKFIVSFVILIAVIGVVAYLLAKTDLLIRFQKIGFDNNGRFYLYRSAINAYINSDIKSMLCGIGGVKSYLRMSMLTPTHSFTESSYFAVLILFGLVGLIMFIFYIRELYMRNKSLEYRMIIVAINVALFFNDLILYPLGFMVLIVSVVLLEASLPEDLV